jgi:hypothetical protein
MIVSFRVFAVAFFIMIGWVMVAGFLKFEGFYFLSLLIVTIMVLEGLGCLVLVIKVAKRFPDIRAPPDEIRREDDVLLQGTPFISAILFFYLTTLTSDVNVKVSIGLAIVLLTGTFYVLRAIAKIKCLPNLRLWSIFFLVYLGTSTLYEIAVLLFPTLFPFILSLPQIIQIFVLGSLIIITVLPTAIVGAYFPKRYGAKIDISRKRV